MHLIVSRSWPWPRMLIWVAVENAPPVQRIWIWPEFSLLASLTEAQRWGFPMVFDNYWSAFFHVFGWSPNIWEKEKSYFLTPKVSLQSSILIQPLIQFILRCPLLDPACRGKKHGWRIITVFASTVFKFRFLDFISHKDQIRLIHLCWLNSVFFFF